MSNLIKSVYFNVDPEGARVIDSDEKVDQYIPTIFEETQEEKDLTFQQLDPLSLPNGLEPEQQFEDGLSVISMDDVASQEREKIEEEIRESQEELLSQARAEAEEIIAQARAEADAIREQAQAEGMQSGLEQGQEQVQKELEQMREELSEEYAQRFQELDEQEKNLEPAFADIIVSLVRKITGVVCEDKRDVILYLIGSAIRNLEKTSQVSIRVSKEDVSRVSARKSTLKAIIKSEAELDIIEDNSLDENQCIIETDHKVIDCSLDAQLQNLEDHVKLLLY